MNLTVFKVINTIMLNRGRGRGDLIPEIFKHSSLTTYSLGPGENEKELLTNLELFLVSLCNDMGVVMRLVEPNE